VIEIRGVWKRFGDLVALEPLDLTIRTGETVALVGPNGAGKSTALRILAGILAPSGGHATIAGRDAVTEAVAARRALGYLPQQLGVPPPTVVGDLLELVAAARGIPFAQAAVALAEAGLGDRMGAVVAELSGGQRQRLLLACATLGDVRALLLDEPSISLDADGAEEVREAIRAAARRGAAILFASHSLHDVALLADRIVVMVHGRVTAAGTLAHLAAAADVAWREEDNVPDAPIERIYRVLVQRGRERLERAPLRLLQEDAA
jgi:ABC-2 type transport system ATP-binding protein